MGHSYKGSAVPFKFIANGQPPYLVALAGNKVVWYFAGSEPDQWGLYYADDVNFGDEIDLLAGSQRNDASFASPGDRIVVRGVNGAGNVWQTQPSGVVTLKA